MNEEQIISIIDKLENIDIISHDSLSSNEKYPLYLINYKGNPAVLKTLSVDQASLYQHLLPLTNTHLEKIYDVCSIDKLCYSINEFIPRPSCFNYKLFDSYYNNTSESLSLYQYIENYNMFEKAIDDIHFIPEKKALNLLLQLVDGLTELSKAELVHGDLSPQNILLTDKNNEQADNDIILKIIDYGTLRPFKNDDHPVTEVVGTKEFAAPEILAYNVPNDRIDIYSLGCLLHYMCLGISPSEKGLDAAKTYLSYGVYNIIKNCTSEYSIRYSSMKQLRKAIIRELRIPADTTDRFMAHVPGFRTNKLWKKIIASIYYLWLISYIVYSLVFRDFSYDTWLFIGLCIAWVIFVCDAFKISEKIPWYNRVSRKHVVFRYAVKLGIFILLFSIYWILWYLPR